MSNEPRWVIWRKNLATKEREVYLETHVSETAAAARADELDDEKPGYLHWTAREDEWDVPRPEQRTGEWHPDRRATDSMTAVPFPRSTRRSDLLANAEHWLARVAAEQGWTEAQVVAVEHLIEAATTCDGYGWVSLDDLRHLGPPDEVRDVLDGIPGYILRRPLWKAASPDYALNLAEL